MFWKKRVSYIYFRGQRAGMKHSTFHSAKSGRFVVLARILAPPSSGPKVTGVLDWLYRLAYFRQRRRLVLRLTNSCRS